MASDFVQGLDACHLMNDVFGIGSIPNMLHLVYVHGLICGIWFPKFGIFFMHLVPRVIYCIVELSANMENIQQFSVMNFGFGSFLDFWLVKFLWVL